MRELTKRNSKSLIWVKEMLQKCYKEDKNAARFETNWWKVG